MFIIQHFSFSFDTALALNYRSDHDELRYSIRSIVSAFPTSTLRVLHLIVGDSPFSSPASFNNVEVANENEIELRIASRLAQVPQYLNLSLIEFSGINKLSSPVASERIEINELGESNLIKPERQPIFRLHPHSEIFKTAAYGEELSVEGEERDEMKIWQHDEREARRWREKVLPSFNSLAIESQIPNLNDMAETVLYLNDDFFILKVNFFSSTFSKFD